MVLSWPIKDRTTSFHLKGNKEESNRLQTTAQDRLSKDYPKT